MNEQNLRDISQQSNHKELSAKGGKKEGMHLTTTLKKLLSAEWAVDDPRMKALIKERGLKETVEVILVLRRILNATEGDDLAIERIFDRIDGKVAQKNELSGNINVVEMPTILKNGKQVEYNIGDKIDADVESKGD